MDKVEIDYSSPVRLTENVYWVGGYIPGDSLQCHVYLIENGRDSILIDPGSRITLDDTVKKINEIIDFSDIKYFICQHQDPDITASLVDIDRMVNREDAVILSHWRAIALLKHYNVKLPMKCVEEMGWVLSAGPLKLEFIFTPYLHFPGAFTTYDREAGILFSSDIFGGFTEGKSLFAENAADYFEAVRVFHEHYMPSREILRHSINKFAELDLKWILPQHGSIVNGDDIGELIKLMRNLDCGVFLLADRETDIHRLSKLNRLLSGVMNIVIHKSDFSLITRFLLEKMKEIFPVSDVDFIIRDYPGFDSVPLETTYMGRALSNFTKLELCSMGKLREEMEDFIFKCGYSSDDDVLALPLFSSESGAAYALVLFFLEDELVMTRDVADLFSQISLPLGVALERMLTLKKLKTESNHYYTQAITDTLTGLNTRLHMEQSLNRILKAHDRNEKYGISVLILDLDHFKRVNDTYGHLAGDRVLKESAGIILTNIRGEDLGIRLGGEEFAVFVIGEDTGIIVKIAERILNGIRELSFSDDLCNLKMTISGGIAYRRQKEELSDFMRRADEALYRAKESGRDRLIVH